MGPVVAYHRPEDLGAALGLLARAGTVALAGGTTLNPSPGVEPVEVVDLQALGLDTVDGTVPGRVRLGAMVTLQQLADEPAVPAGLRELARREAPSSLRTLATVGGTVAVADPDSELLAGLLVHDAVVRVARPAGETDHPLADLLADRPSLAGAVIVAVTVASGGAFAAARTGRTPADRPIVAAVARRPDGGAVRLALTGVGPTPLLVTDLAELEPFDDFRGSAEYRRHLAATLAARVEGEVA